MPFAAAFHGDHPGPFQLIATYAIGLAAAGLTLLSLDITWKTVILAVLVFDWVGGIVANAAETVRTWWRARPKARTAFLLIHLLEVPLLWWLTGGGLAFYILVLVLAAKLSIFVLGEAAPPRSASTH